MAIKCWSHATGHIAIRAAAFLLGGACLAALAAPSCQRQPAKGGATATRPHRESTPVNTSNPQVEQIVRRLRAAPAWSAMRDVSAQGQPLLDACEEIAREETPTIRAAMAAYVSGESQVPGGTNIDAMSKVYVLNRVLFDVPGWRPLADARFFGGWVGVPQKEGRVDLLWPLSVTADGTLKLTGGPPGYSGDAYDALGEFDHFASRFGRRASDVRGGG
jgi:hypothetical protein